MTRKRLNISDDDLLAAYEAGNSLTEIEKKFSISDSAVSQRLRTIDKGYSRRVRVWQQSRREALILYIKGYSLRAIGRKSGVSASAVMRWLRAMHPDYKTIARRGVLASTADFMKSNRAKAKPYELASVERWLSANLETLLKDEGDSELISFGLAGERSRCRKECSQFADYRDLL